MDVKALEPEGYAPLAVIDISALHDPVRRPAMIAEVEKACIDIGFFYIVNHGIPKEQVERAFALERALFDLSYEEKNKFNMERLPGNYFGYKGIGQQLLDGKTPDGNEFYNTPKNDTWTLGQPDVIVKEKEFVEGFMKQCHAVTMDLLDIYSEIVQVPESMGGKDFFRNKHRFEAKSGDHIRMMKVMPKEKVPSAKDLRMGEHTDFGTTTLVFSQPVGGLQVLLKDGTWPYVKHVEDAIVVNIGDAMQFWTNGYLRSNFHRVVQPPPSQKHLTRYSLVYFLRPENDVSLAPIKTPKTNVVEGRETQPVLAADWIRSKLVASLKSNPQASAETEAVHEKIMRNRSAL